jgi:hypothetical protein
MVTMTIAANLIPLATPLDQLHTMPGNPRRGDVEAVARSLERFGQLKPIVARADGTVIAGNHTLMAARQLGWPELAVVRTDHDDATAKAFALADNRTSELGTYDEQALLDLLNEVNAVDPSLLAAASFAATDLDDLLARLAPPPEVLTDPDAVPDTAPAITATGDVWRLGPHRLICGECEAALVDIAPASVDLLLTDPPYGVNERTDRGSKGRGGGFRGKRGEIPALDFAPVHGDDHPFSPAHLFGYERLVLFGANYYAAALPPSPSWIVWDKIDGLTSDKREVGIDDNADVELAWTNLGGPARLIAHRWKGVVKGSEHGQRRVHPTQKPVALMSRIIEWRTDPGAHVLDPYAGSGSTLIAAHTTGRRCTAIEYEPAYCDVIARRYQEATGVAPVNEATGAEHDFTKDGG